MYAPSAVYRTNRFISYPFQRGSGASDILLNHQSGLGVILKIELVAAAVAAAAGVSSGVAGANCVDTVFYDDGFWRGIEDITAGDLALMDHNGAARYKPGDGHGAVLAGGVVAQQVPIAVLHSKSRVGDRFPGDGIQLSERQAAQRLVVKPERLRVLGVIAIGNPPLLLNR